MNRGENRSDSSCETDIIVAVATTRVVTPQDNGNRDCFSEGSYTPRSAGFARLIFNNDYSRINGKYITYVVQVVSEDVLQVKTMQTFLVIILLKLSTV